MSDDFDYLFETPATAPTPPEDPGPAPKIPAMRMAVFHAGARVTYRGEVCTVNHVLLSKGRLYVSLDEVIGAVPAEKLRAELTHFTLERTCAA